jgi:hypothetical protein
MSRIEITQSKPSSPQYQILSLMFTFRDKCKRARGTTQCRKKEKWTLRKSRFVIIGAAKIDGFAKRRVDDRDLTKIATHTHTYTRTFMYIRGYVPRSLTPAHRRIGGQMSTGGRCTPVVRVPTNPLPCHPFKTIIYLKNARPSRAFIPHWRGLLLRV